MFHHQRKNAPSAQNKSLKDLTRMVSVSHFLAENKRHTLVEKIKEYSALEATRYDSLCASLIDSLVSYCQYLPETTNSYYSQAGGLVEHALNRTEAALSLFKDFMVQDPPNALSEEQKLWQYALFSAALLQGLGKLFIDYRVNLFDINGQLLMQWNPLFECLTHTGSYYNYEFQKESDVDFRRRLNLLMAKALMPVSGFNWIASNPQILAIWLALLNEDQRGAGTLGALLIRADAIALQRYFTELMIRHAAIRGGRYSRPGTFTGGTPETTATKEQNIGVEFIQWLTKSLEDGIVMINKAPLWMVPGGLLMSKEMFQLFIREHPAYKNWQAIQNAFLSLGLHKQGIDGVISRFEQAHNQQMHQGIVFAEYALALPDSVKVYQLNTGKVETMSAIELINKAQHYSQLTQQNSSFASAPLQKLSASGQWQNSETIVVSSPGVRQSG